MTLLDDLRASARDLVALGKHVRALVTPAPTETRNVPFFSSLPFHFIAPDMTPQEQSWMNEGEEVRITKLAYSLRTHSGDADTEVQAEEAGSWGLSGRDFEWNYRISSTRAEYGQSENAMVSRTALGWYERGRFFDLPVPQAVPRGEIVVVRVRPLLYSLALIPTAQAMTVHFIMVGYRVGGRA